eukprot:snap_masked-scaffold_5-processed-gene-16.37-mRNA-1 protein AED:1.00 eAED:1.00 QI:0/0/0/0/1/1/3/0/91
MYWSIELFLFKCDKKNIKIGKKLGLEAYLSDMQPMTQSSMSLKLATILIKLLVVTSVLTLDRTKPMIIYGLIVTIYIDTYNCSSIYAEVVT